MKDRFESLWPETQQEPPTKAKRLFPSCLFCGKELTLQHVNDGFEFCNVDCRDQYGPRDGS